jgi:hypothetical protein
MRSRVVRVTLTLLAVAVIGTASYYYWTAHTRINTALQSASVFTNTRATATRAAFDLRSAQQGYVAAGQNEAYWFERATASLDALRTAVALLDRETTSAPARQALADVLVAADEFDARDRRVRGYASGGQRLLASDVIFADGLDLVSRMVAGLDAAAEQVALQTASARSAAVREQMIAAGTGSATAILVVLILALTGSSGSAQPGDSSLEPPKATEGLLNLDLRPTTPATRPAAPSARTSKASMPIGSAAANKSVGAPRPAAAVHPSGAPPAERHPLSPATVSSSLKLEDLAAVCLDLARLSDTGSIPTILERTASALDASGLVLWIADAERQELLPLAAHGYAPNVLSRMRGLPAHSENVTADAFRTGLVQTVRGDGDTHGAIAAPLVSPAGPVGVLSLEMRQEGERKPENLAAATIVASQLATIVGPAERSADRSIG